MTTSRRVLAVTVTIGLLAAPLAAEAQPSTNIPRIGFLTALPLSVMSARTEAFRQGLRELGYVEGKTIVIEWRSAEGQFDRLPSLAAELVRLKVDVIVTAGPSATRPVKAATVTIPIVITNDNDPVANGFVASLARPGGNITGLSTSFRDIRKAARASQGGPSRGSRAWRSLGSRPSRATLKRYERRNTPPRRSACSFSIWTSAVPTILRRPSKPHARGALTPSSRCRAPSSSRTEHGSSTSRERAASGDVYAASRISGRRGAHELRREPYRYGPARRHVRRQDPQGGQPADLPIEQPTKFDLIIDLKAAKQIGLTIPPSVLARADEVIQ